MIHRTGWLEIGAVQLVFVPMFAWTLLMGCVHAQSSATPSTTLSDKSAKNYESRFQSPMTTFRFAINAPPQSIDPARATAVDESQIINNLYEGLIEYAVGDGGLVPGVAQKWTVSKNRKIYVFHLRKTARWSDGKAVTAEDFRWSWLRVLNAANRFRNRSFLFGIQGAVEYSRGLTSASEVGIEAVDPHTLRVTLVHPMPHFLELCATTTLRPVPIVQLKTDPSHSPDGTVTNGPYRLTSKRVDASVSLIKNESYWDASQVAMTRVEIIPVNDNMRVAQLFDRKVLDWTGTVPLPLNKRPELIRDPDYHEDPYYGVYYLRANVEHIWLKDTRIRQILSMAVDRDAIAEHVGGGVRPAFQFVPPTPLYPSIDNVLRFDPKRARALLKEVGPRPLRRALVLSVDGQPNHRSIAQLLVNGWKTHLGLDVRVHVRSWKQHMRHLRGGTYHLGRSGWIGDYRDPLSFLALWDDGSPHNFTAWRDREYIGWLARARRTAQRLKRFKALGEAERILIKRGPVIPLFFYSNTYLLKSNIAGLRPNILGQHPVKYIQRKQ